MRVSEASKSDNALVLEVELDAFKGDPEIETLVPDLLDDDTAAPLISCLAWRGEEAVGHILLTQARLREDADLRCMILAPLAVRQTAQRQGVGQALMAHALHKAKEDGIELVFVLGHPNYYPKAGFAPAFPLGFSAPFPIATKDEPAWMVTELVPNTLATCTKGTVLCAEAMNRPEYWRE